jgi:hypothetical protein
VTFFPHLSSFLLVYCYYSSGFIKLSFPESANRWDRWKEPATGTGSSRWRGPACTGTFSPFLPIEVPIAPQEHEPLLSEFFSVFFPPRTQK